MEVGPLRTVLNIGRLEGGEVDYVVTDPEIIELIYDPR